MINHYEDKKAFKDSNGDMWNVVNISPSKFMEGEQCLISPIQTLVDCFGDVYICCYYRHRPKEHKIGSILEESLKDILGSKKHMDKLIEIDYKKCNLYDCRFLEYQKILNEIDRKGSLTFI